MNTTAAPVFKGSASQLATWYDCPRKYGYTYVRGIYISSQAADFGGEVHEQLATYLNSGTINEGLAWDVAKKGLHLLPTPSSDLIVERKAVVSLGANVYTVIQDLVYEDENLVLLDHKTCGRFTYALTAQELPSNIQAVIYAQDLFQRYSNYDKIIAKWVYYPKHKRWPEARAVNATLHRETNQQRFDKLDRTMSEIVALRKKTEHNPNTDLSAFPKKLSGCPKYGGCPHQGDCLTFKEILQLKRKKPMPQETKSLSLTEMLKQSVIAEPTEPTEPTETTESADEPTTDEPTEPITETPAVQHHASGKVRKVRSDKGKTRRPRGEALQSLNPPEQAPDEQPGAVNGEISESFLDEDVPQEKPEADNKTVALPIGTLYIDCSAVGIVTIQVVNVLASLDQSFCKEYKEDTGDSIASYRCVEYGKGPALFCLYVKENLRAPCNGWSLEADSRSWLCSDVMHVLEALSHTVVRGRG